MTGRDDGGYPTSLGVQSLSFLLVPHELPVPANLVLAIEIGGRRQRGGTDS